MSNLMSTRVRPALAAVFPAITLAFIGCQTTTTERSDYHISDGETTTVLDAHIKQLTEETQKYPLRADLWYQIAAVHYEKSDFHESVAALKKAIAISPDDGKFHYQLGRVYLNMGDTNEAEMSFRKSVSLAGGERYTGPYAALGWTLSLKKDYDGALEQFKTCKELEPENPLYDYALGFTYDLKGEKELAIAHFEAYLSRGGDRYRTKTISLLQKLGVVVQDASEQIEGGSAGSPEGDLVPGTVPEPKKS